MNRKCKACNKKLNEVKYLKKRTVCKSCYNRRKRKNNKKFLFQNQQLTSSGNETCASHQQPKINDNEDNKITRSLIIRYSKCGKIF